MKQKNRSTQRKPSEVKRAYISQSSIPQRTLREAMTIAQALTDNFAGQPAPPHQVAMALQLSPRSSNWSSLSGAAEAYGLTKGAINAENISLEALGRRATIPTEEGDDIKARAEAVLKPIVCRQFFNKYNKNKFPQDHIAINVLREDFKVPADRANTVLEMLKDNGAYAGFIHNTKTGPFVALDKPNPIPVTIPSEAQETDLDTEADLPERAPGAASQPASRPQHFKVFISHSRNMEIVEQVKDILSLYDIEFELAIEEESTAIPVPQKITAAMRRCQAAVMVVTADAQDRAQDGYAINNNVLIEVGAAFVLYDQRVVLLWDKRLKVPSNLQGLYRCDFEGSQLSFTVGTKLARAIKAFKG